MTKKQTNKHVCIFGFRPDLIEMDKLVKEEPITNLNMAFDTAEREFGVIPLLDAPGIDHVFLFRLKFKHCVFRGEYRLYFTAIDEFGHRVFVRPNSSFNFSSVKNFIFYNTGNQNKCSKNKTTRFTSFDVSSLAYYSFS